MKYINKQYEYIIYKEESLQNVILMHENNDYNDHIQLAYMNYTDIIDTNNEIILSEKDDFKTINIKGIHNKYEIKKVNGFDRTPKPLKIFNKIEDTSIIYHFTNNMYNCIILLQNMYNETNNSYNIKLSENDLNYMNDVVKKNIKKKYSAYKQQDNKNMLKLSNNKKMYDLYKCNIISYNEIINKLIKSKLICGYCCNMVNIIYETSRDNTQWTLERTDNTIGHSCTNTIIACLGCNLKRRNSNIENFIFTKTLIINKK
jgi:hypothetical protein